MKKLTEQKGYVLLWVLFLLSVTMLWGSLLLLNTSDQYEVSNGRVREEQSQLLARSGWNLALQQLETTGGLEPVVLETRLGSAQATVKQDNAGFLQLAVASAVEECKVMLEGQLQLAAFPWSEVQQWPIIEKDRPWDEPGCVLSSGQQYVLERSSLQPIAITTSYGEPVTVLVQEPIELDCVYIYGNLELSAPLKAEAVYISGQISGMEWLDCAQVVEAVSAPLCYRVQVMDVAQL